MTRCFACDRGFGGCTGAGLDEAECETGLVVSTLAACSGKENPVLQQCKHDVSNPALYMLQ